MMMMMIRVDIWETLCVSVIRLLFFTYVNNMWIYVYIDKKERRGVYIFFFMFYLFFYTFIPSLFFLFFSLFSRGKDEQTRKCYLRTIVEWRLYDRFSRRSKFTVHSFTTGIVSENRGSRNIFSEKNVRKTLYTWTYTECIYTCQ